MYKSIERLCAFVLLKIDRQTFGTNLLFNGEIQTIVSAA